MSQLIVDKDYCGARLDKFLKKSCMGLPQGLIEKWCRKKLIIVDGVAAKASGQRLRSKQTIMTPNFSEDLHPEERAHTPVLTKADKAFIKSLVIYEHEDFWALNKPSGLAVQGGTKIYRSVDSLLPGLITDDSIEPKIVHRIDKDTSGLLLIAKNLKAAQFLTQCFKEKLIKKTYFAIVNGCPDRESGTIDLPIGKCEHIKAEKMVVDLENGLEASTQYELIRRLDDELSLIKLTPVTGRTHQIRVHCSAMGWPIIGDGKYGGTNAYPNKIKWRLMLHADTLELYDTDGAHIIIRSPYQTEFDNATN